MFSSLYNYFRPQPSAEHLQRVEEYKELTKRQANGEVTRTGQITPMYKEEGQGLSKKAQAALVVAQTVAAPFVKAEVLLHAGDLYEGTKAGAQVIYERQGMSEWAANKAAAVTAKALLPTVVEGATTVALTGANITIVAGAYTFSWAAQKVYNYFYPPSDSRHTTDEFVEITVGEKDGYQTLQAQIVKTDPDTMVINTGEKVEDKKVEIAPAKNQKKKASKGDQAFKLRQGKVKQFKVKQFKDKRHATAYKAAQFNPGRYKHQ